MTSFQKFVLASGLTNLADGVAVVVWAWVASLISRDPLMIALVPVALRMPWFLCAIPAGIIADRVDRRRLILAMDAARAGAFALAAISLWLALPLSDAPTRGVSSVPLFLAVLIAATIVGVAEVFRDNAAQTMLPALVPHDRLEQANGRLWSVELVGNALIGPALGAFFIASFIPLPFALNAIAYGIAIVLVAQIAGQFKPPVQSARNWRRELAEGYAFLRDAALIRLLALLTGGWNLLFQMKSIALILIVQENMGLGATAFGLILAAGAVGGIIGGQVSAAIIKTVGRGRTVQLALAATPITFLWIAFSNGPIQLAAVIAVFEFTGLVWNTVSVSYRQRQIPDHLLGRVNSLYRLLAWGMMPVGLVLSGLIVRIGETFIDRAYALILPIYVAAFGGLILTILGWRALGRGFSGT
ncbi:major facilitator superfamily MFS_1 [Rhodobacteraceae bacterium HTCC2150]|nr:major facilitator superfamily MFS_1 [Rhodobacteraceae bacterium HTCC2150]